MDKMTTDPVPIQNEAGEKEEPQGEPLWIIHHQSPLVQQSRSGAERRTKSQLEDVVAHQHLPCEKSHMTDLLKNIYILLTHHNMEIK
jgi:hypothetical protein